MKFQTNGLEEFEKVMNYLDSASEEDLKLLNKLFELYSSPKEEQFSIVHRLVVALFENPKLLKFIPQVNGLELRIKVHGQVCKMEDVGGVILSHLNKQEPNPVSTYLAKLPKGYMGDIADKYTSEETLKKRKEMQTIQTKINSKLNPLCK